MSTPQGWYPDPDDPEGRERWWNGERWSSHSPTRPKGTPGQERPRQPGIEGWWNRLSDGTKAALVIGIIAVAIIGYFVPEEVENVDLGGAPDVRGLALPDARAELRRAKFRPSVKSEGLGIVVEENWTVCEQDTPNNRLVPIRVSKECEE